MHQTINSATEKSAAVHLIANITIVALSSKIQEAQVCEHNGGIVGKFNVKTASVVMFDLAGDKSLFFGFF